MNAPLSTTEKRMARVIEAIGTLSVRSMNRMSIGMISGSQSEAMERSIVMRVAMFWVVMVASTAKKGVVKRLAIVVGRSAGGNMVVVVRGIDWHVEQIDVEQRKGAHSGTKPNQTRGSRGSRAATTSWLSAAS